MADTTEQQPPEFERRRERTARLVRRRNASALNAMTDPGRIWVVANATPQREFISQGELAVRGFPTFVPATARRVAVSPYSKHKINVARPILSQLIFVGIPADYEHVHALLRLGFAASADDRPGALLTLGGAVLREFVERNDFAEPVAVSEWVQQHARFTIGTPIDVVRGPFAGQPATLAGLHKGRARIDVSIFGTTTAVDIPLEAISELS